MPSFPKSFLSIEEELERIRTLFKNDLNKPCLIVANGPSSVKPNLTDEEIKNHFIIRMNWFFLEKQKTYGSKVNAFLWSVDNKGIREALALNQRWRDYSIEALFQPHISSDHKSIMVKKTENVHYKEFDHWAVIATCPELGRSLMSRPLPTQGMQAIAFAAILGFKKIRVAGIDMYGSSTKRYAWSVPKAAKEMLKAKDLNPGYEPTHDLDRDLRFLEITRTKYDFELLPVSDMPLLLRKGVFDRTFSIVSNGSQRSKSINEEVKSKSDKYAYVTHADGRYFLGALALARSLEKVSKYKLIVMYSEPEALHFLGHLKNVELRYVDKIKNPFDHGQSRFKATFTKLRVFEIEGYDKLTFVDSDAVVLKNIDDLFEMKGFYAAPDLGMNLPDAKPTFNSGLFSFEPNTVDFIDILRASFVCESDDGGDQGFLNNFFQGRVNFLPIAYNTLKRALVFHPELINIQDVKVLHFVGAIKPWDLLGGTQNEYFYMQNKWAEQLTSEDWIIFYHSTLKFTKRRYKDQFHRECQANYQLEAVESKKRYNEIFGRKKMSFGRYLDEARLAMESNNRSLAIYLFTQAYILNSDSTNVLIELADAYKLIGDVGSEIEVLQKALEIRPERQEISKRIMKLTGVTDIKNIKKKNKKLKFNLFNRNSSKT